jgi:kynurenine formamidase
MELIDLSRELFHRTQTHPSHPPVIVTVWGDHSEKKVAGNTIFTSKALSIALSDHAGTHVDAPVHFDPRPGALSIDQVPLEDFFTSAICLDLSDVPLKHAITVPEMQAALDKSGQEIRPRDTVLIYMATNERLLGKAGYLHDFPGLALESVHWLADRGILMFGRDSDVRCRGDQSGTGGRAQLSRAHGLCRTWDYAHGMSCQFGQAGWAGAVSLHRLSAEDPGGHR